MDGRKLLQARVPENELKKLKDIAKKKGVSLNSLIIFMIEDYNKKNS